MRSRTFTTQPDRQDQMVGTARPSFHVSRPDCAACPSAGTGPTNDSPAGLPVPLGVLMFAATTRMSRVPTESEIVGAWEVARTTDRRAVALLRDEGLVDTVPQARTSLARPGQWTPTRTVTFHVTGSG